MSEASNSVVLVGKETPEYEIIADSLCQGNLDAQQRAELSERYFAIWQENKDKKDGSHYGLQNIYKDGLYHHIDQSVASKFVELFNDIPTNNTIKTATPIVLTPMTPAFSGRLAQFRKALSIVVSGDNSNSKNDTCLYILKDLLIPAFYTPFADTVPDDQPHPALQAANLAATFIKDLWAKDNLNNGRALTLLAAVTIGLRAKERTEFVTSEILPFYQELPAPKAYAEKIIARLLINNSSNLGFKNEHMSMSPRFGTSNVSVVFLNASNKNTPAEELTDPLPLPSDPPTLIVGSNNVKAFANPTEAWTYCVQGEVPRDVRCGYVDAATYIKMHHPRVAE